MKLLDDRVGGGLLLVGGLLGSGLTIGNLGSGGALLVEPGVKVGDIRKHVGEEEAAMMKRKGQRSLAGRVGEQCSILEKSPKLVKVVLERGTSDEETGTRVEDTDDLGEHRVDVLDAVSLVDEDVLPRKLLERRLLAQAELVGGDENVEVLRKDRLGDDLGLRRGESASL